MLDTSSQLVNIVLHWNVIVILRWNVTVVLHWNVTVVLHWNATVVLHWLSYKLVDDVHKAKTQIILHIIAV